MLPGSRNHWRTLQATSCSISAAGLRSSSASRALGGVAGEPRLNHIPQLLIDDRRVIAGVGPFLVNDLAPVDAVLQHQVERAAREWFTTPEPTGGARPALARAPPANATSALERSCA